MSADKPFDGQLALVTGASRGIGAAVAKDLAAKGAQVVIVARDAKALEKVEDEIHAAGGHAIIAPMDLAEQDAIPRLAAALAERFESLDLLVLSAAVLPSLTPVTQIDAKQFGNALTVNVLATQTLLASLDPMLKRSKDARVVGLTSSVGEAPRAYWSAYGSTKAAFDNLLESYAQEVAKIGHIRVAIVDPGATRTQMRARAYPGEDPKTVKQPEVVATRLAELVQSDFTTGHRERVDG